LLVSWLHLEYAPVNRILETIENRTLGRNNHR
jgi:hypothetical protein